MTRLNTTSVLVFAVFGCLAPGVRGGSVIVLPGNSAIVNIDARADGAGASANSFTQWYQPFQGDIEYTVQAGTYNLRIVDPTDAQALYPSLTLAQSSEIFTAWTFNSPWVTNYLVFDSSALTNPLESQLIYGAPATEQPNPNNASAAYALAKTGDPHNVYTHSPYYNLFFDGQEGVGSLQSQYTFASAETLVFAIPDNGLDDNGGGVSVLISPTGQAPAVPAPSGLLLMGIGLASLGAYALRKRRKAALA